MSISTPSSAASYEAKDIQTLEILDAIRKRPGMYLGDAGDGGVLVAVGEVIDNSVDEHMNGHGNRILVCVDPETRTVSVEDWGRGIPTEPYPQRPKISTLEATMTLAHTGGKFGQYGISGGLHGTGLKVVTATSSWVRARVWRSNQESSIEFKDTKRVRPLGSIPITKGPKTRTGMKVEFQLDPTIFVDAVSTIPSREALRALLHGRAFLNPELALILRWGREEETFQEKEGIGAYVRYRAGDGVLFPKVALLANEGDAAIQVSLALAWTSGNGRDNVLGYTNSIFQSEGGTHVQGLRLALPGVVRAYVEANKLLSAKESDLKLEAGDCFEGVYAVVAVRHRSPTFAGQAKSRLSNNDAQGAVQRLVNSGLARWLEENPREARALCSKAVTAARARAAAAKAREQVRKQDAGSFGLHSFGKLADCSLHGPGTELFIVEGESAGGSAKMSRERRTQAVYPLKGKPLNDWEKTAAEALANVEISDLASAIGTGLFEPGATLEQVEAQIARMRYEKVVILPDGDIDGAHIACLLLGHFYRHMCPLIVRGHIYLGQPPLYRVTERNKRSYLRGEAELGAFYAARVAKANAMLLNAAGTSLEAATRALARRAGVVRRVIEDVASAGGYAPGDVAHAFPAGLTLGEGGVMELAEAILARREADGCEGATGIEVAEGTVVLSGLEPGGRYFTTVVDERFRAAVAAAWEGARAEFREENQACVAACAARLRLGDRTIPADLHSASAALEVEVRKGVLINRFKGLGEMQSEELGETTLDPETRTLVRVTVADFDEAGRFMGLMLTKSKGGAVEARREVVRAARLGGERVDA